MDQKQLLGMRIRGIRRRRGLSQDGLAERAGISAQYVSNIERGKENPTLDLLIRLADALDISFGDMCDVDALELSKQNLQSAIQRIVESGDPEQLRVVLKIEDNRLTCLYTLEFFGLCHFLWRR